MSREDPQLKVRLTSELKDKIEAAAAEEGRSMNAEIVARLQQSFEAPAGDDGALRALAVALATAEERSALRAIESESRLFVGAALGEALLAIVSGLPDEVELTGSPDGTLEDLLADAQKISAEARRSKKGGHVDDLIEEARVAIDKLARFHGQEPRSEPLRPTPELARIFERVKPAPSPNARKRVPKKG